MLGRNLVIIISFCFQSILTDKVLPANETEVFFNENKTDLVIPNISNITEQYLKNTTNFSTEATQNCFELSETYGAALEKNETGYNFSVSIDSLKRMDIYSEGNRILNGFRFQFLNESEIKHGHLNETHNVISIDMQNKEIRSIQITHGYWVNAIQFEIYDKLSKNLTRIPQSGNYTSVIPNKECSQMGVLKITKIIGFIDSSDSIFGDFIQSLKFEYTSPYDTILTTIQSKISTQNIILSTTESTISIQNKIFTTISQTSSIAANAYSSFNIIRLIIVIIVVFELV